VFAFFVQIWAVRRTSPSRVSLLLGTEPVWAAAVGITIAHDQIGIAGYCGIALILTGTAWGRSAEQRHRPATRESPDQGRRPIAADGKWRFRLT
jgi:drug/metabolite transporter (DMT)-like permease